MLRMIIGTGLEARIDDPTIHDRDSNDVTTTLDRRQLERRERQPIDPYAT